MGQAAKARGGGAKEVRAAAAAIQAWVTNWRRRIECVSQERGNIYSNIYIVVWQVGTETWKGE